MADVVVTVFEADGTTQTDVTVKDDGRELAAASRPVVICTEDKTALDAAVTALQVMDDWDESDRAKVNIIAGQAGVAAGAGTVGATVVRTTQASDSPLVAATGAIGDSAWASGNGTLVALLKTLATAALDTATASPVKPGARDHETVAASQTDQMCGATGAAGDILDGLLVTPLTTSPGQISIEYGSTNIVVFQGGASSVSNLVPFFIDLRSIASVGGGWEITTGANVQCIAVGDFT